MSILKLEYLKKRLN